MIIPPSLPPILISRFLFNLRQVRELENPTQGAWNSDFTITGFRVPTLASFVGNMCEELDFTLDHVPCEPQGNISVGVPDPAVGHPAEEFGIGYSDDSEIRVYRSPISLF
ncbi:hypothetical protein PHLCEN_2v2445 [Hermanssonia centrifuga]|uniref:Uncharacterized protein n=1 Tax=Hermanssonia centrifuga TaxID=98765 RepID=A0A2R6RLZ5_9APHY|nr:hypothetical protein PHLCEN_2v2445 [Hermanssonia centrifuga]